MFSNSAESLVQLKNYFLNNLEELNVPELIRMENSGHALWNGLIINNSYENSQLKRVYFSNLEQAPYVLIGSNIRDIDLESLLQVEIDGSIGNLRNLIKPTILQNTKIQTLNLPNFKGTTYPTSLAVISSGDISNTNASNTSFWNNNWLTDVVFGNSSMNETNNSSYKFNGFWFKNSYFLRSLRLYYPYVIPMVGRGGFLTTPIGTNENEGYIYVPANLVTAYQQAEEWSEYATKIRPLSAYREKTDTITDSWDTIISNCQSGNVSTYPIGGTKTVEINGIPTQFILVGKGVDQLHPSENSSEYISITSGKANLSWMERTISRFSTPSISQNFNGQATYASSTVLHAELTNIYNQFESKVKNAIKKVIKYSRGCSTGIVSTSEATTDPEYIWPPSAVELGLSAPSDNAFRYTYFTQSEQNNIPEMYRLPTNSSGNIVLNYYLGDTKLNTLDNQKIYVATRDYNNGSAYSPNCLRPSSISGQSMEIVENGISNPYLIIGFCT